MADLSVYDPIFKAAGEEWNVHPLLLKAIATQESGGNTRAVSKANAQGLMQIIPDTQRYLGVTDPNNPQQSIYGAAKYLSEALDAEGGAPERALLYYHGGPDWRQAYGPESRGYVPAVTAHYVKLARATPAAPSQAPAPRDTPAPAGNPDIDPKTGLVDPGRTLAPEGAASAPVASTGAGSAKEEDYSDFLKRTGAIGGDAASGKEPDYSDFLKRTGATPSTTQAAPAAAPPQSMPAVDDLGRPIPGTGGTDTPLPGQDIANRIIGAGVEGWRRGSGAGVPDLAPETTDTLRRIGIYGPEEGKGTVIQRLNEAGANALGGGVRVLGGILGGAQAGVTELLPGGLGRDIAALPEAFPFGHSPGIPTPPNPLGSRTLAFPDRKSPTGQRVIEANPNALSGYPGVSTANDVAALPPDVARNLLLASEIKQAGGVDAWLRGQQPTRNPLATAVGAPEFIPPGTAIPPNRLGEMRPAFVPPGATPPPEAPTVVPPALMPPAAKPPEPPSPAGGPSAGMGGPQPQAAGAQVTPAGAAVMTPEQAAAHRYTADKQWLMKSKPPGEADTTEYVPGINPTAAQQEQTAVRAREMKTVRNMSPEVAQSERELLSHHNDKRKDFYAETAGSEVTRQADMTAAEQKIEADLRTVWQNKGKADARPIIEAANTELDGSAGLLPPVRNVAKQITGAVTNADGSLKTDPQQLYQARRLINYMQSKAGRAENPGYGSEDVQASLVRMKAAVDQVIEPAAPGFGKAISDYAQARGPIDAAEELQARETGLLDGQNRMQYSKVHNLLRDIIEAQKAPASPLAHISEAQLTRLKALHDDLQRVASAEDLARASGSDTVQNAADAVKALAKMGARGAAHAVANTVAPGVGSLAVESVLQGASRVWEPFRAARAERGLRRRGQELLYPPEPKGGRTPNALGPD